MLFNSIEFLLFLAVFLLFWPALARWKKMRWIYITIASIIFYGWWDWRFIPLLLLSGSVDYLGGLLISKDPKRSKLYLVWAIGINFGLLIGFKYYLFILQNLATIFSFFQVDLPISHFSLVLPVGISFYTFQSMSYMFDVYRRKLTPTRNFFHYFSYLTFFPQLVAGPIVRASDLLSRLEEWTPSTYNMKWTAIKLIAFGYFKKVVIADNLAVIVDPAFEGSFTASGLYWWIIILSFGIQIYCDFSGYSDIARGLLRWLGYDIQLNFDHPYLARSLREFWKRWHISLSTWFRDYVYIPLGGSSGPRWLSYRNIFLTMALSGLWHGAGWNFLLWGVYHATFLILEKIMNLSLRISSFFLNNKIYRYCVILQVFVGWVIFRSSSLSQAKKIIKSMFSDFSPPFETFSNIGIFPITLIIFAIFTELIQATSWKDRWERSKLNAVLDPIFIAITITISIFLRGPQQAFIYFQF